MGTACPPIGTFVATLALALLCSLPVSALEPENFAVYSGNQPSTLDAMLTEMSHAEVVFVGEEHDSKQAHVLERMILEGLHKEQPDLALSLEMFERDVQPVVDEYVGGFITETHFLQASRPWPNYKEDYRPLVEFCKDNHIPVIAANAPRRYVNIVSRQGQQALLALPKTSRAFLSPLPISMDLPPGYSQQLDEIFGGAHDQDAKSPKNASAIAPPASAAMPSTEHMKQAQALWDATMQDSILRYLRAHRGAHVLQMNGAMHSDAGFGIVDRLRKSAPKLRIITVTIRRDASFPTRPASLDTGIADFVIVTPEEKQAKQ